MTSDANNDLEKNNQICEQSSNAPGVLSRRFFLSRGLASASSLFLATGINTMPLLAKQIAKAKLNAKSLKTEFKFKGDVLTPADADFRKIAFGRLWNKLQPNRLPQIIACVADEQDVVAAVKFARANKLKVCVRGGGHNWCCPTLRNSGILIDLTNLNKVISIDAANRKAILQPIISNREVQAYLKPYNLAYPTGHCPPVKISGYLLSGGMSWNQGVWGHGIESLEAIELVTPEGEMITASAEQNQDYFWAARGGGPGFFGVAVRYHLKLHALPKALSASVYHYPYENLVEVAEWLGPIAKKLPSMVELSLFVLQAPKELEDKCKSSAGKLCMVTATVFADSHDEVIEALKLLDTCPVLDKCLSKSIAQPTDFEALFDASGALWPGDLRNQVDAVFSNAPLSDLFKSVDQHLLKAPSEKAIVMFAVFTGENVPAPLLDACFSMTAKLYGGPWTMWDKAEDDKANIDWHAKCIDLLKPMLSGHYVSETDTVNHPEYARASYREANWKRLAELRKKYDPDGVFFNFTEGLS
jgi:FAD/FMN-containing dehydrogenase